MIEFLVTTKAAPTLADRAFVVSIDERLRSSTYAVICGTAASIYICTRLRAKALSLGERFGFSSSVSTVSCLVVDFTWLFAQMGVWQM